jgi:phosphate-selective porin OprO/OprP
MKFRTVLIVAVAAGIIPARVWAAADSTDEIKALKEEIQVLDQKVRVLERQREVDQEVDSAKAKDATRIVAGNSGLSVSSADTNFVFQLHGLVQVDNRSFLNDHNITGNDGFLLRRARPIFSGTLYHDIDFMFVPDFGGSTVQIFDAYLNYRAKPWLQLRAGKFKVPVGIEQLQSDPNLFFNERGLPNNLIPNRDIGFMLWGDIADGIVSYAAGVFNGVGDNRLTSNSDFEDHREFAGRVFFQPFKSTEINPLKGLGFGVSGTWGTISSNATGLPATTGGSLPGFVTDGQQQFFAYNPTNGAVAASGVHWRVSPQGYYYWGPVGVLGEYVISDQHVRKGSSHADLQNTAWQVAAGWTLTGEDASYTGINPKHPFNLAQGQWGAWQVAARYAELDVDDAAFPVFANSATSATGARAWSVGLNWYLNKNLRASASFSRTTFTGGGSRAATTAPGVVTRQPEEVLFTRLQLAF